MAVMILRRIILFGPGLVLFSMLLGPLRVFGAVVGSEISLDQDKLPCIKQTQYLPVMGEADYLKTTWVFVGYHKTNAAGEVIETIDLPEGVVDPSLENKVSETPAGASMVLKAGPDNELRLGPAILSSLSRVPARKTANHSPLDGSSPSVAVQSPVPGIVTQPMIEILGTSDEPLR